MSTDKTAVALRVLTAINDRKEPDERDVLLLRAYCPDFRDCGPDELACVAIQEELKRKKMARERLPNRDQSKMA